MENDLRYFEYPQKEALGFYMFHCFNISKHIRISVLFFIISVSYFVGVFAVFLKIIVPGWGFSTIFLPQRSGFRTFFVPRVGEFAFSKKSLGLCLGGHGVD